MFDLPKSLIVEDKEYPIRSDYRDILTILLAFNDPLLDDEEKSFVFMSVLFPDFPNIETEHVESLYKQGLEFIDAGVPKGRDSSEPLVYWEQDAPLIFAAINKNVKTEIRNMEYLHWWTFLGYFMEIGESLFSTVLGVRQKKAKNEKLDEGEKKFLRENDHLVKRQVGKEEREEIDKEIQSIEAWL